MEKPNVQTIAKVNGLDLFNETIAKVKALKLFNTTSELQAGNDFHLETETNLLHPSFYITEVYGGDVLVQPIAFDKDEQSFFLRSTGDQLTVPEVMQHVKRGLIPWITGGDYAMVDRNDPLIKHNLDGLRVGGCDDFVTLVNEALASMETFSVNMLDRDIDLFEAETEEEYDEIEAIYIDLFVGLKESTKTKLERMHELIENDNSKVGILGKLAGLFR